MKPTRRTLLAAAALVPTACAAEPVSAPSSEAIPETSAPVSPPSTTSLAPPTSVEPSPPPEPTPSPEPSPTPIGPSRAEIVERYAGAEPEVWGLEMEGVVSTVEGERAVLTLDACGGPRGGGIDERILGVLRQHAIPATLFLNARWIEANPALTRELADDPLFELANHGTRHVPLSVTGRDAYGIVGTADPGEAYDEVMGNQAVLADLLGAPPRFFRSGTAHYDDVAVAIARDLGCVVAGFSINGDGGATLSAGQTAGELMRTEPGDIILGHINQPNLDAGQGYVTALPELLDRGIEFAKLGEVI